MKALVVDDSRLARDGLVRMLSSHSELEIIGSAADAEQARLLVAEHRPDLLFLDIHMPLESGFELLESLDYTPRVIFTTAYSEYAIHSFDYHTVDYLLKPISQERLMLAISKLDKKPVAEPHNIAPLALGSQIFVKDGDHCCLIQTRSISVVESCKNYARLFFDDRNAFVKKSLNQIEQRLPSPPFFRASRQFIVNLNSVRSIDNTINDGYEITMNDGRVVAVSRRNATRLREQLSL